MHAQGSPGFRHLLSFLSLVDMIRIIALGWAQSLVTADVVASDRRPRFCLLQYYIIRMLIALRACVVGH
jgi:hypothetical protein